MQRMNNYVVIVAILHVALGGELSRFSVQMPYLNPAGVTYRSAPPPGVLAAGPAFRTSPLAAGTTSVAYGPLATARYTAASTLAQPLVPQQYSAHPLPLQPYPTQYLDPLSATRYHAVPHAALAEVDTIHHVPGVADIPVTRYEAQHGYVQKLVDVAKAKVATRKIEVRRPAIEKMFYDIEERIVIRPAGSAVVELNQPLSETQKGPTLVSPAVHPVHHVPIAPIQPSPVSLPSVEDSPTTPQYFDQPADSGSLPIEDSQFDDSDSIAVDNPEISGRAQTNTEQGGSTSQQQAETRQFQDQRQQDQEQQQDEQQRNEQQVQEQENREQQQQRGENQQLQQRYQQLREQQSDQQLQQQRYQQLQQRNQLLQQQRDQQLQESQQLFQNQLNQILNQYQRRNQLFSQVESQMFQQFGRQNEANREETSSAQPQESSSNSNEVETQTRSQQNSKPTESTLLSQPLFRSVLDDRTTLSRSSSRSSDLIQSLQNLSPEQLQENQQRLIALLTARGGVAEVGFGRSGVSVSSSGDAGQIKARVLSVTPAPYSAAPAGERVHTRRIVVSRPIQTVQEVDVVEPFTKLERVAVHEPAILKTAKIDVARVHTSVPVVGRSFAPAVPLAYLHH